MATNSPFTVGGGNAAQSSPFTVGGGNAKASPPPQPDGSNPVFNAQTKPLEVAPQGPWTANTNPAQAEGPQTKPLAFSPSGTPSGSPFSVGGGVTIDSSGLRTYADGSTDQAPMHLVNGLSAQQSSGDQSWQGSTRPLTITDVSTRPGGGGGGGFTVGGGGFGASPLPSPVDDASRRRVEEAILARLEPQFEKDMASTRNQLLSSGLEVGSPAYTSELERLARNQNDARISAVMSGGQEESRQVGLNANLQGQAFNQGLQGAQFDNATRQQMLSELLLQRNTPLNELNALRTGSQVAMPNFQGYYTNNAAAAPMFDAAVAQGNYDAQQAANNQSGFNALIGGAATAGAAFF